MAGGAVLEAGVGHVVGRSLRGHARALASEVAGTVVTFQAQGEDDWAAEQPGIGRSVRRVAGLAAFHTDNGMLEGEGSALLGVALEAGFFVCESLVYHARTGGHPPGGSERAVRVMAIRAGHGALVYPVLKGHRELGANIAMTGVAEFGLFVREQELGRGRFVNRVTARADDVVQGVGRTPDVGSGQSFGMAAEALVEGLLGCQDREGDDVRLGWCLAVGLAGSVAALAAGVLGVLFAGGDALEMRVLVKTKPDVRVTGSADVAAYEARWVRRLQDRSQAERNRD